MERALCMSIVAAQLDQLVGLEMLTPEYHHSSLCYQSREVILLSFVQVLDLEARQLSADVDAEVVDLVHYREEVALGRVTECSSVDVVVKWLVLFGVDISGEGRLEVGILVLLVSLSVVS